MIQIRNTQFVYYDHDIDVAAVRCFQAQIAALQTHIKKPETELVLKRPDESGNVAFDIEHRIYLLK